MRIQFGHSRRTGWKREAHRISGRPPCEAPAIGKWLDGTPRTRIDGVLARSLLDRTAGRSIFTSNRLGGMHIRLHPSLSVVASLHPIYSIWHMNRDPVRFTPVSPWVGEAVLGSRPRLRVRTCRIAHGDAAFIFAQGRP